MEALIFAAVAYQVAQRSYNIASSLYRSLPKSMGPITIEITSSEGRITSKETITPTSSTSTPTFTRPSFTSLLDSLTYNLHTIFLFAYNDTKTVLLPWTLFGVAHAMSASFFDLTTQPTTISILIRLPQIILWIWLHLVAFTIGNQRNPEAIKEDSINKSWRPIPAGRITPAGAFKLQICAYIVALSYSFRYGGISPSISLFILAYIYNDTNIANKSSIAKNLINGLGFVSFGAGAMEVALGHYTRYSPLLVQWLRLLVVLVTTMVHAADMYDQEGDALSNRNTLPLVIGDKAARYVLAVSVLAWSVICPYFWSLSIAGYVLPMIGGLVVAKRTLTKKSVTADKKTYKVWLLWLIVVYCLPLIKVVGAAISV